MNSFVQRIIANCVVGSITFLGVVFAFVHFEIDITTTEGKVMVGLLVFLLSERLLTIIDIVINENPLKEFTEQAVLLRNAVVDSHIEVYTDYNQAYETIISIAKNKEVISLKNTVFRYGETKAENIRTTKHPEWIKAKESIINKGREVNEVFDFVDPTYPLLNCTKNKHSRYSGKCISRDVHDCIQMTIFEYVDRSKEIFIGGDIGVGTRQRRSCSVFRTRNNEFIHYFEIYFDALHEQGTSLNSCAVSDGD